MALIPPFFLDCVVAIGVTDNTGQRKWIASGFLYGKLSHHDDATNANMYWTFLVTNRHVLENHQSVVLRFNPRTNQPAREFTAALIDQGGVRRWYSHPDAEVDVAVVPIVTQVLENQDIQFGFFKSDSDTANVAKLNQLGITEGDFAYVLGFPMGLVGQTRNTVIVRSGTLARVRDALQGANKKFLVDAFTFPGNSGGPVVSKPEALAIQGTPSQNAAYLVGLVTGYQAYQERAISEQTGRPRVIFEDNSGLTEAHPMDFVDQVIQQYLDMQAQTQTQQTPTSTAIGGEGSGGSS